MAFASQGSRERSSFAYDEGWLEDPEAFNVSPDLQLRAGYQPRRAHSQHDSPFPFAFADTAPDAWGRRLIARDHAKRRKSGAKLGHLTEMDYLLAVDDFSRVGALRFSGEGEGHRYPSSSPRPTTPPLIELRNVYEASHAVEQGTETADDLSYLQGKGTSLGGARPKCTILDADGTLAIGKFPSVNDDRSVARGEVLALRLAHEAGIVAAPARIVELEGTAIAVISRFDRHASDLRIPYMSAASLLQASREEERAYTEIADAVRATGRPGCQRKMVPSSTSKRFWQGATTSHFHAIKQYPY